jgi:hypothetical protein
MIWKKMSRWACALGVVLMCVGFLSLGGCDEKDQAKIDAMNAQAAASGNPLLIAIGAVVSTVSSVFIAHGNTKKQVTDQDHADWTDDDVASMGRKLEQHGYVMTRKPPA